MRRRIELLVPCEIVNQPTDIHKSLAKLMPTQGDFSPIAAQPDLLFMRSLLVSTGGNRNDDVFLPDEMWKARSTPILKPVDWEHNTGRELTQAEQLQNPGKVVVDNQTIGVMYNAYTIDENGARIEENLASADDFQIPNQFHIIDEAVIWKALYPVTANRVEKGAADGTLFVSMEAWFTDYNYIVGDKVIARNEQTAFLENSLKANGGTGVYGNSRVRRALRNITFGGKGIVARPANDPSVITHVSHEPISAKATLNEAIASNIIGNIKGDRIQAIEPRKDTQMSEHNRDVPLELLTEAKGEVATLKAEAKQNDDSLATSTKRGDELQSKLDSVTAIFTKGAALLDEQLPGFSSRVTMGNPENFFGILAEQLEGDAAAKAKLEKSLEESLAKIVSIEKDVRSAARETKIDALLALGGKHRSGHEDKDKDKDKGGDAKKAFLENIKKKKEKMSAAVKDLTDEQFDALYEVWADQQAEANEMNRGSLPVEGGSDVGRGAQNGKVGTASLEDTVKAVLAAMVANPNKGTTQLGAGGDGDAANPNKGTTQMGSGAGEALNTLKSELLKRGHAVSSLDAIMQAIAGHQEPSDEDNLLAILDGVQPAEVAPSAGAEAQQGIDLTQSFAGLVNRMLDRDDDEAE